MHDPSVLLAPDNDLISWVRVVAREEPEEELSCLIFFLSDGQEACVTLADVPCDIGESATVDGKGWVAVSQESTPMTAYKTYVRWLG
jgi:hypothetical protein